jgi:hypothetical protein
MRRTTNPDEFDDVAHHDVAAHDDDIALRPVPDLRGLRVEDASGIHVGQLYGALAEADTGLVRYIDLALATLDRHVLVPIGHARVQEPEREAPHVRLRAALLEELEGVPPFPADVAHISDPFERALLEAYGRTFHGERYYAHPAYDHDGLYAGPHPVIGPDDPAHPELARLSELRDWRVADDEIDIVGWPLRLATGERADVTDLIVDTRAGTVRYVMTSMPGDDGARLIPVGYLRIDPRQHQVDAPSVFGDDLRALPHYDGAPITRDFEDALAHALHARFSGSRRYDLADFRTDAHATSD